jgi:CIC family chloride channel protein
MVPPPLSRALGTLSRSLRLGSDWPLLALASVIGVVMGSAALAFVGGMQRLEDLVGQLAEHGGPSLWVAIALPIVGAGLTGAVIWLLPSNFKGHGVSRVMFSVYRERARLPAGLAVRQWVGSTCTIASGGSAGPEGPIVAIGATIASRIAIWIGLDERTRTTLLGCGAAAGISAVFNAPIAGVFFVLEVILREFSMRTFTPIVVASVIASATAQTILGSSEPIFGVGPGVMGELKFSLRDAPLYAALGAIVGVAAAGFALWMSLIHSQFDRLRMPVPVAPIAGAALLVAMGAGWWMLQPAPGGVAGASVGSVDGLPPFYGSGYALIDDVMRGRFLPTAGGSGGVAALALAALTLVGWALLKATATGMTLGSGGAGGLFAPSLVLGCLIGAAFGALTLGMPMIPDMPVLHGALTGMGAFVAAGTHAPLTGAFLVYELTQSYAVMLPLLLASVIAVIVARLVHRQNIYTAELVAFGVRLGGSSDQAIMSRVLVRDVALKPTVTVRETDSAEAIVKRGEESGSTDFPVVDADGRYRGMICGDDLNAALVWREAMPLLQASELAHADWRPLRPDHTLHEAMGRFTSTGAPALAVVDPANGTLMGVLTRAQAIAAYSRAVEDD